MDKEFYKEQYIKLRRELGRKPKIKEFYSLENVTRNQFIKTFGNNPYTRLQEECGDKPNKLVLERTPTSVIFKQFGNITRKLGKLPTQADWSHYKCKPTVSGMEKSPHNLMWKELPVRFLKYAKDRQEWEDVIALLEVTLNKTQPVKNKFTNEKFTTSISIIREWIPQRKRFNEEGYKVDLRAFLEKRNVNVEEEKGESNIDLLIDKSIAVELKKDPSVSEFDRLFGQMARHLMNYKYLIVVVCDVSSEDRYKNFMNIVDFIYSKINLNLVSRPM